MHIQNAHIQHSVDFSYVEESVICLPCRRPCSDQVQRRPNHPLRSHFHCPFCLKIITRSTSFKNHIECCNDITVRCTGSIVSERKTIEMVAHVLHSFIQIQPMLDIFDVSPNDMTVLRNFVQLFQFNPYVLHSDEMLFLRKWLVDEISNPPSQCSSSVDKHGTNNTVDQNGVNDISDVDKNDGKIIVAIKSEPEDIANLYECTDCKQQFTSASGWQRHMEIYHSIDAHKLECKKCKYTFKDKHCLARHIRRGTNCRVHKLSHNDERPFACDQCEKRFKTKQLLTLHSYMHTGEKPYSCGKCDAKHTHTGFKPHKCKHCEKRFYTAHQLLLHQHNHDGKKLFHCKLCTASYCRSSALSKHVILKHTRNFKHRCP
uniref:C2H2-type domain-containing protein n=1 Tax=Ciona intestinalis TaxID=7719 RepID=F6TBZ1_CIOIN